MQGASKSPTTRRDGALLGISMTTLVAAFLYAWSPDAGPVFLGLGLIGCAAAGILGHHSGTAVLAAASPTWAGAKAGVQASLIGTATVLVLYGVFTVVAIVAAIVSGNAFTVEAIYGLAGILIVAVVILGVGILYSLPVTVPIGIVAVRILRRGRSHPQFPARVIGTTLVAAVVLIAFGPTVTRPIRDGETILSGPVDLQWTVANRSPWFGELDVNDPNPADQSISGTSVGFDACAITHDHTRVADDWYVNVRVGSDVEYVDWDPAASPVVGADTAPGALVIVWIDIAPDGTVTLGAPRLPTDAEASALLC